MIHVLNVQDRNRLKSSKGSGAGGTNVSLRDLLSPAFRNDAPAYPQTHKRGATNLYSEGSGGAVGPSQSMVVNDEVKTVISKEAKDNNESDNVQIYFHQNPNRSSGINSRSSVNATNAAHAHKQATKGIMLQADDSSRQVALNRVDRPTKLSGSKGKHHHNQSSGNYQQNKMLLMSSGEQISELHQ